MWMNRPNSPSIIPGNNDATTNGSLVNRDRGSNGVSAGWGEEEEEEGRSSKKKSHIKSPILVRTWGDFTYLEGERRENRRTGEKSKGVRRVSVECQESVW